ncbi:hypothetical protein BDB00DRAFT_832686 [Zychaea mexicana]|uniref:uncharacterized protein n=1 Tax=Zychaea mexicana TaxID=64656 RepID=UPI0022FE7E28|nr:uncharacterized protein BDB00DRAFT_832686 [Zychaea mexicana]KAI9491541.1 hypothetical protein BDB00DRAFT_832686 [Zychaea mexicana]
MLLTDSSALSLHLLEDTLYLDLDADNNHATTVLRGFVDVMSPKKRVHSLHVCFEGYLTTKRPSVRKQLIQRHLVLNPSSASTVNGGMSRRCPFEMSLLLGGLPDTIESKNIEVVYHVTAKAAYAYSTRSSRNCPIRLTRFPFKNSMLTGDNVARSIDSRRHHAQFFDYHLTIEKSTLSVGASLPLTMWVAPRMSGVRLLSLCVFLVERRSVYGQQGRGEKCSAHLLSRADPMRQSVPGHVLKEPWRDTIEFRLPDELVPSMDVPGLFVVRHTLKVSMAIVFPEITSGRVQRSISFETDVEIRDRRVGMLEKLGAFNLPEYEHTSITPPCTPPPVYEHPPAYSSVSS